MRPMSTLQIFSCAKRLLVLIVVAVAFPAQAGPYHTAEPLDRAARVELASELLTGFQGLQRELPTLSPAEREWLSREERDSRGPDGKTTRRYLDLTDSREWKLRAVESPVALAIAALRAIKEGQPSSQAEMVHWLVLARMLSDFMFWQDIARLIDTNVIDKKSVEFVYGGPSVDRDLLVANASNNVHYILDRYVIPTLNAEL